MPLPSFLSRLELTISIYSCFLCNKFFICLHSRLPRGNGKGLRKRYHLICLSALDYSSFLLIGTQLIHAQQIDE